MQGYLQEKDAWVMDEMMLTVLGQQGGTIISGDMTEQM